MSRKCNILIIDPCHPVLLSELDQHEISYQPAIDLVQLEEEIQHCDVLIMRSKLHLDSVWIDRALQLKVILRLGSGMDNIDTQYAASKGIECMNAPEGNRVAVAEQTIGMLLSLLANIGRSQQNMREGKWARQENSGVQLSSMVVGIIGYGNVGTALADRLLSFGCQVLAYDLFKKDFGTREIQEVSLENLKRKSDIISLHIPLNQWSKGMVNQAFIESVEKPFYLLNLSRGDVVETKDLVNGLKSGKIRGLALDVYENEKLSTHSKEQSQYFDYLRFADNVVFTPHTGGLTNESFELTSVVAARKLKEYFTLKPICELKNGGN